MTINVLLTGAGGLLAHFMYRALLASKLALRIVACDYSHNAVGLYRADVGYVVPPAKDADYIPKIIEICQRERVDIIMIGSMAEMRVLAQNKDAVESQTSAVVVASPPEVIRRAEDKWELTRYLAKAGYAFPISVLPGDRSDLSRFLREVAFPYVVKDRFGSGSERFAIARNERDLDYLVEVIPNPVVQEYLYPDDEEYTVGVFVCRSGVAAASIVMKRQLGPALTSMLTAKAEVLPQSELGDYCERVVEGIGCVGPCNVQLRVTNRGPVVFEINPRFSSTTSARPHFGYNDAAMCIRHFVLNEEIQRPSISAGRLFRVVEDVFVEEAVFDLLRKNGRIENPNRERSRVL